MAALDNLKQSVDHVLADGFPTATQQQQGLALL